MLLLLTAGCTPQATPQVTPGPSEPPVAARPAPTPTPDPVLAGYLSAAMTPLTDDALGITLAYPESFDAPFTTPQGALVLRFQTGDVTIYKDEHPAGQSLAETVDQFIAINRTASMGRIVADEKGTRQLGGREVGFVQTHFASAAGRWDRSVYFVVIGGAEYRVSCGTKEGPPPIKWEAVAPICARVLGTIQFKTPTPEEAPIIKQEGAGYRLTGLPNGNFINWAPSGRTGLVEAAPGLYRLRLDTLELRLLPELGSLQMLGWAGPDTALMARWSGEVPTVGELALTTGAWRPLASVSHPVAICQSGEGHWVWVDVTAVRQGGTATREIGTVYRTPVPAPTGPPAPLAGEQVLDRGALLGRLADGSCLLDAMDGRLMLVRPDGALQTLTAEAFFIPEVTRDGRGVVWRDRPGVCTECIEAGYGPFARLTWWRLDGTKLTADLGAPQEITYLLSPDGERLVIGHGLVGGIKGAISELSSKGFQPGAPREPALLPAGWLGADLLTQPAGLSRWAYQSPIYRAADGAQVAEWLTSGVNGSLLIQIDGGVRFLAPDGQVFRLSQPVPQLQGTHALGIFQPQAPYLSVRDGDDLLLIRLEGVTD